MLVDAFMFYNEFDVLELRLELLDSYVDLFVLVEAEVNHIGGPKPLFFEQNKERYARWAHKIRHVIMTKEEAPTDKNPWSREKYQRACITRGIEDVPDESIVMISDVDEIPDMAKVPYERLPHAIMSVHMWLFIYSLDYLCETEPWYGTVITQAGLVRKFGPNDFRDNRWKFPTIQYAGWHLSSFGDEEHVLNKMKTYAHALDGGVLYNMENIKKWIAEGKFVDGKTQLIPRGPEVPLPGSIEVLRRLNLGTFP
jgi:beta-1,4-mannosyl-glycoprotein beta-1,4-N-acetylglucosaminyltransferase